MKQQNTMAATAASNFVEGIATLLFGDAGAGITDLIVLADRVEKSAAGRLGLLLDQERVAVMADHSQPTIATATVGAHEVHPEVVDVRLELAEIRELADTGCAST